LSEKKRKKIQMPGAARAGISLLIMGALLVAFGQYLERGALSLYGVIIVACGFVLYMTASIIAKRRAKI
jgi:membrane-bound ClpP family serine protease